MAPPFLKKNSLVSFQVDFCRNEIDLTKTKWVTFHVVLAGISQKNW